MIIRRRIEFEWAFEDIFAYIGIKYSTQSGQGYVNRSFLYNNSQIPVYERVTQVQGLNAYQNRVFTVDCSGGDWRFRANMPGRYIYYTMNAPTGTRVYCRAGDTILDYTSYTIVPSVFFIGKSYKSIKKFLFAGYSIYYWADGTSQNYMNDYFVRDKDTLYIKYLNHGGAFSDKYFTDRNYSGYWNTNWNGVASSWYTYSLNTRYTKTIASGGATCNSNIVWNYAPAGVLYNVT